MREVAAPLRHRASPILPRFKFLDTPEEIIEDNHYHNIGLGHVQFNASDELIKTACSSSRLAAPPLGPGLTSAVARLRS